MSQNEKYALERITTEYVETEDRLRIAGAIDTGETLVIWLTQRLLQRLVPVLLEKLEQQMAGTPRAELLQSFAQQAAKAELRPQPPVHSENSRATWLVVAVDITQLPQVICLRFRGSQASQLATLELATKPLRQWLSIMHEAYTKAAWPSTVWPEWIQDGHAPRVTEQTTVWH